MDTPFGIVHLWTAGDWIHRSVALILLGMSVTSWVVIALKTLALRQQRRWSQRVERFWHCHDVKEGLRALGASTENPFYLLVHEGQGAMAHIRHPDGDTPHDLYHQIDPSEWVIRSLRHVIDDATVRLQSGLVVLASIGSTAPFVGLFGTVWGIYHALLGMGSTDHTRIDQIAGPIGEALIMTALGLVVAIPAVLGYNALVRANKSLLHRLNRFAHDLHAYFVTGARVSHGMGDTSTVSA